jgi:DNA-binding GntR family transcriptional regulator
MNATASDPNAQASSNVLTFIPRTVGNPQLTKAHIAATKTYSHLRVLLAIAFHHYGARIDKRSLQHRASVSRSALYKALADLQEMGLLSISNGRFFITPLFGEQ